MFGAELVAFLESGCGVVVAGVDADGAPSAGRGWGISVVSAERRELRVLIDADDAVTLANLRAGAAVAVTAANVGTYSTVQVKGRSLGTEAATPEDDAKAERHVAAFHAGVLDTDGTEWPLFQRFVPSRYAACTVVVEELFDQTPGPGAGARIGQDAG